VVDCYIEPYNLYGVFTPLAIYAAGENMADYNLTRAQRAWPEMRRFMLIPFFRFWAVSTQIVFTLNQDYFPEMGHLSQWLHGSWQSAYKSDPNFHLNMPNAGSLKIRVQNVSPAATTAYSAC